MAAIMTVVSMAATVASTAMGVMGAIQQGEAANEAAQYEARQRIKQANEARAIGQKKMFEQRRQTEMADSRLRAVSAATGGDTTDVGTLRLGEGIAERGEYNALTEMALGENRGRGYEDMASAAIYKGKVSRQAGYGKAVGSVFDGIGSFGQKYMKAYG
jgi:hypothetical protein